MISASCAISRESVGKSFSALARTNRRMADSGSSEGWDAIAVVGTLRKSVRTHQAHSLGQIMENYLSSINSSFSPAGSRGKLEESNQRSHRYPTRNGMT